MCCMRNAFGLVLIFTALAAHANEPVTIFFWGSEWDTLALDLIQDFETRHDGRDGCPPIKVIMGQTACINNIDDPQRLMTAIAGGDPPDVVWFNRYAVGGMAARGAFESLQPFYDRDLAEYPNDPMTLREEQFFPACWSDVMVKGELFAIPADTDNRALYYNKDIFDKHANALIAAGCVDPDDPAKPGPPRDWDQLRKCAEILTERDDNGRLIRVGFIPNFGNSWLYLYSWLNGGRFLSPDGRTCTLNGPETVEALAYVTEIYDLMGGAEAVSVFQTSLQGGDLDPFLSGKIAMRVDGDGFLNTIANQRRDMRFGVVLTPPPAGKKALGWSAGWSWAMPKGARHPNEAWKFIKHLASRQAYEIRANARKQAAQAAGNIFIPWFSARRDVTEWALEHYLYANPGIEEKYKDAMRVFFGGMSFSEHLPITPVGQLLWTAQVRALDSGIFKRYDKNDTRKNAQIALDLNAKMVQTELDRIYNPKPYPVVRWAPLIGIYVAMVIVGLPFGYWHFGRRVRARGYFRREHRAGYFFAMPWLAGFILFGGGPICFSLLMSFCQYDVLSPPKFVGLDNYTAMLTDDPLFYKSLWNTLFMAIGIPLGMALSLAIALLLNYEIKGMAIYRTFFYLPAIMPAVAASILWVWIFNPDAGILNALLAKAGVHGPAWLQNQYWSKPALIVMGLWGAGSGMIVWLAGLKGIPRHLYEAAELDGAGRFRQFFHVTIPMLSPYILFNLIMGIIGTFQIFTQAFIMTQGGPLDSTLFYAYHLFNNAFRYMKMGYASAMAWFLFAIVLVLTVVQLRLSRIWVHYETEN
ncbi:MAG TPA: extracellular solute-binding protein [Candidatus Hydrogenedentes bacterium]|nr:extracellular solute-binding protein [Candidatus Hydrogenedentota bacterium]